MNNAHIIMHWGWQEAGCHWQPIIYWLGLTRIFQDLQSKWTFYYGCRCNIVGNSPIMICCMQFTVIDILLTFLYIPLQPNPKAHKLTCRYSRHHPYWLLRPLKEETMYHDPWIRVYHDLLTNEEVAKVKELASPRVGGALVSSFVTVAWGLPTYAT